MGIFDCERCGCAENTAMAPWHGMWGIKLCTLCKTGEWHNEFERFVRTSCPDCGSVDVKPDVFFRLRPISGVCPKCNYRLNF